MEYVVVKMCHSSGRGPGHRKACRVQLSVSALYLALPVCHFQRLGLTEALRTAIDGQPGDMPLTVGHTYNMDLVDEVAC